MNAHLITVLFKTTKALEEKLKENIKTHHLTITEFGVLEALYTKGPLQASVLCEKILVPNSSMTYTLDKLERNNYIERKKVLTDKRSYLVTLNVHAYDAVKKMIEEHYVYLDKLICSLTEDEQRFLRTVLKKVGKQ